ncbi:hypothetical protein N658DRAFT_495915 [Parathielavia hyrcaniae]|uniref:Thioredoxin domain-containing protein n=1 Tax=Parathielavia hyrcaniae TaxID=113614 RepID=A0AAN6T2L1_9PEZI|nr:hypothetical protein N658DRAFT_495915 [Parathielavia hyrcaniae]
MSAPSTPNPAQQFDSILGASSFVFLLYYRGHWCPFCIAHLKELVAISDEIKAAGGAVVAATAEAPPELLQKVRSSTGFTDTVIVDPENLLAKELKSRGLVDVAITDSQVYRLRGYKHGMAQPALLVLKSDGTALQRWAIVPALMNLGGATDRPILAEVWEKAQKQLRGEVAVTTESVTNGYTTTGVRHLLGQKLFGR